MLKRFMNWLLHRLQRLLGVVSGKNGSQRRSSVASQRPFILDSQPNQSSQFDADYVPSAISEGSLPNSPTAKELRAHNRQGNEAIATNILDPMLAEPDTHRRLNASSAALPGAAPQVPSFPTEVSELISSSSEPSVTSSAEPEELPAIQDLLPAIEQDESEDLPEPPAPQAILCSFDITESEVSSTPNESGPTVEPVSVDEDTFAESLPEAKRDPERSQTASVVPESSLSIPEVVLSPVREETVEEKASELKSDNDETIPASDVADVPNSESQEPAPVLEEQSLFVEEGKEETTPESNLETPNDVADLAVPLVAELSASGLLSAVEDELLEPVKEDLEEANIITEQVPHLSSDVTDLTEPVVDEPSASDLLPAVEDELLEPHEKEPKEVDSVPEQVTDLPYPWSLAASNKATQAASNSLEIAGNQDFSTTAVQSSEESGRDFHSLAAVDSQEIQPEVPVSAEETSVKHGVVKLLFTLKPGNFHGYIAPDDGTQDILFHQKYINADAFDQLSRGAKVVVTVKYLEGKAYAKQVDLL